MAVTKRAVHGVAFVGLFAAVAAILAWTARGESVIVAGTRWYVLSHDDAMISMRYARNLARGDGLVWNVGERVQGYTNLGWTLVMAGVHALRVPDRLVALPMEMAAAGAHLATGAFVALFVRRRLGATWALAVAAFVAFDADAVTWTTSGWEVAPCELLWTVSLLTLAAEDDDHARPTRTALVSLTAAALAAFLRLDGSLLLVCVAAYWLVRSARSRDPRVGIAAVLALAVPAAIVAWQHGYYGDWFPNTARLKRSTGMPSVAYGAAYGAAYLAEPAHLVGLVFGGVWCARASRTPARGAAITIGAFVVAWFAYVDFVGGDCFNHGRFFVPLFPALAALASLAIAPWLARAGDTGRLAFAITAAAVGARAAASLEKVLDYEAAIERDSNRVEMVTALALRRADLPADAVVGVFMAGTVPYFNPDTRFHDMLGKSDRRIASGPARNPVPGHNRWDYAYTLDEVRPDLLITSELPKRTPAMNEETFAPRDGYNMDLFDKRAFQAHYARNRLRLRAGGDHAAPWIEMYGRDTTPLLLRFDRAHEDCTLD